MRQAIDNTISTIQEFTMRSQEMGIFSQMFNDMNRSRPEIFEVIKRWAEEFEEENKDTDWAENFYYDEVDNFLADKWEDFKNLVDREGKPYIANESDPAGGGLDKRCDFNKEVLCAFDTKDDYDECLEKSGFELVSADFPYIEVWVKGNTSAVFESYIDGLWGYVHTEFLG